MRQYLLDTNVLIDYLTRREPFGEDATELMQAGAMGEARLYAASLSFANIEYIVRRQTSAAQARQLLSRLARLVEILSVDATTIHRALASDFIDFEDGIQHIVACAQPGIHAIITRDPKGFRSSVLPVLSVAQALTELDNPA
ncbi:PIN domain-containing protein [Hymenobacter sp.]|uniref:type II toxin-antitoxin system VapC family toxin n=1 Tax=Hymenobacter sp. TaxID=1898978 RepID=UPI00286A4A36|nr:PIN domain-containing protein [Hymenobacter sp.]